MPLTNQSCNYINGSVRIDGSSNVTYEQLVEAFHTTETIEGSLEIVNTSFKNLSFFKRLRQLKPRSTEGYDLLIANNTKLESMDGVLLPYDQEVRILDNPLLVMDCTHVLTYYSIVRRIRGNKNNCGCELDGRLTQESVLALDDNCPLIYGDFILTSDDTPSYDTLVRKFATATRLLGQVVVIGTDFADLGFLENVKGMDSYYATNGNLFILKFVMWRSTRCGRTT
ncbi:receptor L domain protein [Cooperia oncophora]